MTTAVFLQMLLAISVITSLLTEALKVFLDSISCKYSSNILAGVVAVVVCVFLCVAYTVQRDISLTAGVIITYISLTVLSWIMSMVGYDKVVQAVRQIMG